MSRHATRRSVLVNRLAAAALVSLVSLPVSATFIANAVNTNSNCPGSSVQIIPKGFGNTIISFQTYMVRSDTKQEVNFFPRCAGDANQVDCPQLSGNHTAYVHFSEGGMNANNVESLMICVGARQYKFALLDDSRNREVSGSFSCTPRVAIGNNQQFNLPRVHVGPSATIQVSTKAFSDSRNCQPITVEVYNVQF